MLIHLSVITIRGKDSPNNWNRIIEGLTKHKVPFKTETTKEYKRVIFCRPENVHFPAGMFSVIVEISAQEAIAAIKSGVPFSIE
jgi:hypothetical protein